MARPIAFLSDYGLDDEYVGLCHAVMAVITPESRVIDLTHAIPPQDVLRGALVLGQALPYLPADAVILAVVDPGVGTSRRPIATRAFDQGHLMVGPDNGLLSFAWGQEGPAEAVEITSAEVTLQPLSRTFHGRDVFAPAAAHLARGMGLDELGPPVDPESLVRAEVPEAEFDGGDLHAEVLGIDRFGNLQISARAAHLGSFPDRMEVITPTGPVELVRAQTFAEVAEGQLAAIVDSAGWVAIVVNRGSAAEVLGVTAGEPITLRAAGVG